MFQFLIVWCLFLRGAAGVSGIVSVLLYSSAEPSVAVASSTCSGERVVAGRF